MYEDSFQILVSLNAFAMIALPHLADGGEGSLL
jgi:hypothetical protein